MLELPKLRAAPTVFWKYKPGGHFKVSASLIFCTETSLNITAITVMHLILVSNMNMFVGGLHRETFLTSTNDFELIPRFSV